MQASTFLGASVIIPTSSLLKRVDLLVDILGPSVWEKSKERMLGDKQAPFSDLTLTISR